MNAPYATRCDWALFWTLVGCAVIGTLAFLFVVLSPANAHDWYTGLKNEKGDLCCDDQNDCGPLADGDVEERSNGYWIKSRSILVPFSRAKPSPTDDGHFHACFWWYNWIQEPKEMPRCFFTPNRGY